MRQKDLLPKRLKHTNNMAANSSSGNSLWKGRRSTLIILCFLRYDSSYSSTLKKIPPFVYRSLFVDLVKPGIFYFPD